MVKKFLTSQPFHLHGKRMIRVNTSGPSNTHYAYSLLFQAFNQTCCLSGLANLNSS